MYVCICEFNGGVVWSVVSLQDFIDSLFSGYWELGCCF